MSAARVAPPIPTRAWLVQPAAFSLRQWRFITAALLPGETDACLLRATLGTGDVAVAGWRDWLARVGDPVRALGTDPRDIKSLVPLVGRNLAQNGIMPPREFLTYVRAAYVTESLRMDRFFREAGRAIDALAAGGMPHVILKGASLAEHVYPDRALRHAHDLDVLVPEFRLDDARASLERAGFRSGGAPPSGHHHLAPLVADSGFTVEIHRRFRNAYPRFDAAGILARSRPARVGGHETRIPSAEDMLLVACVHAMGSSSTTLRWPADVRFIAARLSPADWERAIDLARQCGIVLPVALAVGSLSDLVGPLVPDAAGARLQAEAAAEAGDPVSRRALAFGARSALPVSLHAIVRMPIGWPGRLAQIAWRLTPPPRHLRWIYGIEHAWAAPFFYPYRLIRRALRPAPARDRRH